PRRPQAASQRRHPVADAEVRAQSRTALRREAAQCDPGCIERSRHARGNSGQRVRRPVYTRLHTVRTMTYLVADDLPREPAGERFAKLLERPTILQMPGAYNGLSALQAKRLGFEALYLSGAAMSASMGLPDLGIITVDEVCFFIRQVARASGLPVLVDGATGYGEALNVMHMVRSFEDAGAAAVHIEDQVLPKKCGHLNDKRLVAPEEMAAKIAAAVRARRHLRIIARTDAAASEG